MCIRDRLKPLEFVNVVWLTSNKSTTTDSTGYFFIARGAEDGDKLIFQYLGFDQDTVTVSGGQYLSVVFKEEAKVLDEVVVSHHLSLIHISEPTRLLSISYAVFCLKK